MPFNKGYMTHNPTAQLHATPGGNQPVMIYHNLVCSYLQAQLGSLSLLPPLHSPRAPSPSSPASSKASPYLEATSPAAAGHPGHAAFKMTTASMGAMMANSRPESPLSQLSASPSGVCTTAASDKSTASHILGRQHAKCQRWCSGASQPVQVSVTDPGNHMYLMCTMPAPEPLCTLLIPISG